MLIDKNKTVCGLKLWENPFTMVKELKPLCRKISAEGSVLLTNDGTLPFKKGTRVALFGRNQEGYVKSGTGSGGAVRVARVPVIWDSFRENGVFQIDEELVEIYTTWVKENPFDNGHGWATEPWFQAEMPVNKALVDKFAAKNDAAVVIIGRTAGEDKDNAPRDGSYMLTSDEEKLLEVVTQGFERTVVVLNVGNLIDLSFLDRYKISALLYTWQGGQEGANALADLLSGKISPSGKLPDTQVYSIADYPSLEDFGNTQRLVYNEDIYVGYRYFETFAPEKVRYPFGFGLTYTDFDINCSAKEQGDSITVTATVKNVGNFTAKQVVQVYFAAPNGRLGTPARQLIAFGKTKELRSGDREVLELTFKKTDMAAFDDSGASGYKNAFVLEAGVYKILVGTDVRTAKEALSVELAETVLVKQCEEALAPTEPFDRIVAREENGRRVIAKESTPLSEIDLDERIKERRPVALPYTGDKGIKLLDVAEGKNTMDEFVAQLSELDLSSIVCGEGMNSPKVTEGTGGAIGGVTDTLFGFGIPVCCVTDGPSGLRLGKDYKSTSLPNGYALAASFDTKLVEEIFCLEGVELFRHNIDTLLGPGINIHRHPLNGRNFEYFSEDPLLTGKIAAAQTRGLDSADCNGTIKHFCCNNQESGRNTTNSVISQRALREIYLKGFEIAVKEGRASAIMTSYNMTNGYHCASNYDLATTVLREDWGYEGLVMTDWWAKCNCKGELGTKENLKALVRSQNDVYMVCDSAELKPNNILEGLAEGYITLGELQRNAKNILNYVISSNTFQKFVDGGCIIPKPEIINEDEMRELVTFENVKNGSRLEARFGGEGSALLVLELTSNTDALAQSPVRLIVDDCIQISLSVSGTEGKTVTVKRKLKVEDKLHPISIGFADAIEIKRLTVKGC